MRQFLFLPLIFCHWQGRFIKTAIEYTTIYTAMNSHIKQLVILGGGSAGWMTAAMLSKQLGKAVAITLIESEQIGTVGVGEATIPPIQNFNKLLEIDENDFLSQCNGSIKLGIEFENWRRTNHKYMHPFGRFGLDFDYMPFPYFWLQAKLQGHKSELEHYSLAWHLANKNKFTPSGAIDSPLASAFDHAYHFDATLYAAYLRQYAEHRNVTRVEGIVEQMKKNPETGFIERLILSNGQTIEADFFIDCSGQRALLIGDELDEPLEDWSEYLFNDSAVAIQTAHMKSVSPYTRSVAHHAGWQWRIPLQTRMGNGNVYCSEFMSKGEAEQKLLDDVDGPTLTEPNHIRFKTGVRQQSWKHNCVAIGLSAGFLEPLESTSLHLIQSAIMRLVRLFPDRQCHTLLQQEFNRETYLEYVRIRDFIVLHYKATERDDSEYWRRCREMDIPESLQQRLELFKQHGHLSIHDKELFKHDNWLAVLVGQGVMPEDVAPVLLGKNQLDLDKSLASLSAQLEKLAANSLSHEMFLMKHCAHKPK